MTESNKGGMESYPSQFVSSNEKKQKSYGLRYFKSMWAEYENTTIGNNNETRQERFINLRKYSEGLHSIDKFKDQISSGGDNSYMNLDWQPISVIPKFKEVVVNGMLNQSYKIQCNAIDKLAKTERDKKRNELLGNMFMASKIDQLPDHLKEKLLPKDAVIPEDKEALDLHMSLNYKQSIEIAMEEAIEFTLYNNDWSSIEAQILKDLVDLNIAGTRTYFDQNNDIRIRYVDPVHLVTTYTKDPQFKKGIRHAGEVISMTIAELKAEAQDQFTDEEYFMMAKTYAGRNGNRKWTYGNSYYSYNYQGGKKGNFDDYLIDVMDAEFLTTDKINYEEKSNNYGGYFFQKRSDDYSLPKKRKGKKRKLHSRSIQNVYTGKWIVGSDYLYNYGLKNNMTRDKSNGVYSTETSLSFNIIAPNIRDMENKSLVEKMIPFADQMQLIFLKIQQLIAKSRPKGLAMDISSLEGVMKGMGIENGDPLELQKMYDQLGSFFYSSVREDGSQIMNTRPIEELQNGIGSDIQPLIMIYNQNLQQLRDVTGVNEVRDASAPSKDALVGIDKLRLQASNNATKGINIAYLNLYERTAKETSLMVIDLLSSGKKIQGYYNAIGEQNTKVIEISEKNAGLHEIGIKIQALPDEEEKQIVEGNIQQSLAAKELRLEDSIMVRQVLKQNVKLANQLLIQRRKLYQKEEMQKAQMASQQNAQVQQQSLEAKAQADLLTQQQKAQVEEQKMQKEFELKSNLSAQEHEQKMKEIALQNQYKAEQIKLATDGNFQNTALSKSMPQPSVLPEKS